MHEAQLSYGLISEKSKETGIAFANLLGGAVLEETVRRIGLSEYGETLWLKNGEVLGQAQYAKKLVLHLEYDYMAGVGAEGESRSSCMQALCDGLMRDVFGGGGEFGVVFDFKGSISKRCLQLQLLAELEGMQIPLSIRITPRRCGAGEPVMESLFCMMFPEILIFYCRYPTEEVLAAHYVEIVQKLELIRDVGVYYEVYMLLDCEGVDARKVKDGIEARLDPAGLDRGWKRMEMVAGYGGYAYMKKRWKSFLRSIHSKGPPWESVIERFLGFYEPIWQAVLDETIFLSDWMPEINRFL